MTKAAWLGDMSRGRFSLIVVHGAATYWSTPSKWEPSFFDPGSCVLSSKDKAHRRSVQPESAIRMKQTAIHRARLCFLNEIGKRQPVEWVERSDTHQLPPC